MRIRTYERHPCFKNDSNGGKMRNNKKRRCQRTGVIFRWAAVNIGKYILLLRLCSADPVKRRVCMASRPLPEYPRSLGVSALPHL